MNLNDMFKDRRLYLIYAILLIDVIVAGALGPMLNDYLGDLPGKAIWLTGGTALMLGLQLGIAPAMGSYADKKGRRPAVMITTIGSLITTLLLLPMQARGYVVNRVAKGTTNGLYSVLRSATTDISDKKYLIKTTGLHSFFAGFSSVLGPMFGGLFLLALPQLPDTPLPLVIMMLVLAAVNVALAFFFQETGEPEGDISKDELKEKALNALKVKTLWQNLNEQNEKTPGLKPIFILNLVATLATGYYTYFLAYLTQSELKMEPLELSQFYVFFGSVACLANFVFFRYVVNHVNRRMMLIIGALMGAALMGLYIYAETSVTWLYVAAGVDAVLVTIIAGITGALLSQLAAQQDGQGEAFGSFQALGGLASFVTALVNTGLSAVSVWAPFAFCGAALLALAVMTYKLPKEACDIAESHPEEEPEAQPA